MHIYCRPNTSWTTLSLKHFFDWGGHKVGKTYLFANVKDLSFVWSPPSWTSPLNFLLQFRVKNWPNPKPSQRDPAGLGPPSPIRQRMYLWTFNTVNAHLSSPAWTQMCCFSPLPNSRKEHFPIPPLFAWPGDNLPPHFTITLAIQILNGREDRQEPTKSLCDQRHMQIEMCRVSPKGQDTYVP